MPTSTGPRARPKTDVIRDFVRKVHAVTQARHVPLSLDIFGVVADGNRDDISCSVKIPFSCARMRGSLADGLPVALSARLSGLRDPRQPPGNRRHRDQARFSNSSNQGKTDTAVIRPWLQAVNYVRPSTVRRTSLAEDPSRRSRGRYRLAHVEPGPTYTVTWSAVPPKRTPMVTAP